MYIGGFMKIDNFIAGLLILRKYFNNDGYHCGPEDEIFFVFKTDLPVSEEHYNLLKELGWFQESEESEEYDKEDSWCYNF